MNTQAFESSSALTPAAVGRAQLAYQLDGPVGAPVLVFSNPVATSRWVWEPQVDFFRQHFRVLTYDTRGHGGSQVLPGEYAIEDLGRDVLALLDHLQLPQVMFCGLSLGGMTGIWLAANHPERITRLVLSSCVAHIGNAPMWEERLAAVRQHGMSPMAASQAARWLLPETVASHPALYQAVVDGIAQTSPLSYAACCAVLRDADLHPALSQLACPTLVLAGDADVITPAAKVQTVAQGIPEADFQVLPGSHLLNRDAPDAFNDAMAGFLLK